MSPVVEATLERLEEARQRWWLFSMLCRLLSVVGVSFALLMICVLLDVFLQFSRAGLAVLFVMWSGATLAVVGHTVYRLLHHQRTLEATARRVELAFPELGSHLINLLQLAHHADAEGDRSFAAAAVREATWRVGDVPFQRASERQTRWERWCAGLQTPRDLLEFAGTVAGLLLLAYLLSIALPKWSSSAQRIFQPWRFVPQVGTVKILAVSPGNAEVLVGARLEITAQIETPEERRPTATLFVTAADGEETAYRMGANSTYDAFSFTLPAVLETLGYRLQIGDSQSDAYRVTLREKPTVEQVDVAYEPPAYLGEQELKRSQKHADLEAPQFTIAHLTVHCSSPLSKGYAQIDDQRVAGEIDRDNPRLLKVGVWMARPGNYTLHLFNELGQTDAEPRVNRIQIVPDAPPTVQIVRPASEISAAPGDKLPVVLRAADDHGLSEVRLEMQLVGAESPEEGAEPLRPAVARLRVWNQLKRAAAATLPFELTLDPATFSAGQTVLLRGVAVDGRQFNRRVYGKDEQLAPQETTGPWVRVRIIAAEQRSAEDLKRLEGLNARLWALLQTQLRARILTAQMAKRAELDAFRSDAREIRTRQVQIQTGAVEVAEGVNPADGKQFAALKQALTKLAHGPMLVAAQRADASTKVATLDAIADHAAPLAEAQDQVIETLRKLLEMTRRATSETLTEMKERPGADLPPDTADKLRELAEKLREFARQQKKIIEATENLAKKPVEDFTEEDEQKLKALAQAEDDWSRFMEEKHSDFSKLPEQDFSNPSLLEELIEVQTELKMAEGALTKKTADIAVPLEQLGAEMAEQMTTNIEKWLPDTPDRERWSQEEPLSDAMKEAPLAELPGELEDIVGELMEEEEDLFDEMEDVSSSWADSIDKGAGWDAADGPISNMSARGVTGNRLPNESEIGGRSGEGRQGRSSGEFVSDTAVGKGGRKTPSRLSADPFTKGQVKDLSKDPVGGATGGGKESGAGGEGLEGPVGNRPQRELERLASKQAELRNRAEAVDVKFKVLNYHPTDLQKLMETMTAVERDLKSGNYQSALRRREVVLETLDSLKTYAQGEFEVRRDQSANLPEQIQRELLHGMQDVSPRGWETLNRKYFERLSTEEAKK